MNAVFPAGFPAPTAAYLALYVGTLVVHVALLSYVLFGAGYVAVAAVRGRLTDDPLAGLLRDWLPFAVGAAITAGVAPLLFVQILYQEEFYTANLLLFHRWVAVVPVLMLGFYLLYLVKSERAARWSPRARVAASVSAFVCFVFVAYSWTENHLLALDRSTWPSMYADGAMVYAPSETAPRALIWLFGALPVAAAIIGWQVRHADARSALARLGALAVAGSIASAAAAAWYASRLADSHPAAIEAITGRAGVGYLAAAVAGAAVQALAWLVLARGVDRPGVERGLLVAASAGTAVMIVGVTVARELVRLSAIDVERLYPHHARAAESGGVIAFVVFTAINAGVIVWCFRAVRRGLRAP